MDKEFCKACRVGNWEKAKTLLRQGATNDCVYPGHYGIEIGCSGMVFILAENNLEIKNLILEKYPHEVQKTISILRRVQIKYLEERLLC